MKAEKILVTVTRAGIPAGMRLRLTEKQAGPRMHNLRKIDKDIYDVVTGVEFKYGEEIEVITDGDVFGFSKSLRAQIAPPEAAAQEAAGKKGKAKAGKVDLTTKPVAPPAKDDGKKDGDDDAKDALPETGNRIIDPTA